MHAIECKCDYALACIIIIPDRFQFLAFGLSINKVLSKKVPMQKFVISTSYYNFYAKICMTAVLRILKANNCFEISLSAILNV